MSYTSFFLSGINRKFFRQAFVLAKKPNVELHWYESFTPVSVFVVRDAHDGLYDRVKKRSLEARLKVNHPNNQNQNSQAIPPNSSSSASSIPVSPFSMGVNEFQKFDSENRTNTNVRVLGASGCDGEKPRTAPAGCENVAERSQKPPPKKSDDCPDDGKKNPPVVEKPQNPKPGGNGKQPGGSKFPKGLLFLLTALGAGGLLYWLWSRSDEKEKKNLDECPPIVKHKSCEDIVVYKNFPEHVPYLLIGGGTAAFSAFRAIKTNDPTAKVLMITNEMRKPYMRPPLSKELWYTAKRSEIGTDYRFKQWTGSERSIFFEPEEFFISPDELLDSPNGGIAIAHGLTVKKIDPTCHKVYLNNGNEITYDNCLIATGCTPKILPVFQNAAPGVKERVMVYRTPDDFERLKHYADKRKSIMVVGNGFTGSELACSLAAYAKCKGGKIYQVFAESGNMSRVLPDYLSKWTTRKIEDLGVCVIPNASIRAAQRDECNLKITLNNGNTIITDVVVVCVGCEPNTGLGYASGLEIHPDLGGFVVNSELEARENVFVAGDVSCFYDPLLGRRRLEHHDHSVLSGRLAGENMTGKKKPYTHQSMFWSDLGPEIGYEAIGLVDSSLPTVGVFTIANKVERSDKFDNLSEDRPTDPSSDPERQLAEGEKKCIPVQTSNTNSENELECPDEETYGKGVIFYLKNEKIVGILLWNLFNRIGLARTIIKQDKKYDDLNEVAKLFEIYS